jgi:hypothetical protein
VRLSISHRYEMRFTRPSSVPSFPEERLFEARNESYFLHLVLRYKQVRLYVGELAVLLCNLPYEVRVAERPAECLNSSQQLGAASGRVLTRDDVKNATQYRLSGDQVHQLLTAFR